MKPITLCGLLFCLIGGVGSAFALPVQYGDRSSEPSAETEVQTVELTRVTHQVSAPGSATLVADSVLFFTPSVLYSRLEQRARSESYELESDLYQLQFDIEVVGPGWAYHRVRLGHSFADDSELLLSHASTDVDVRFGQASYAVGLLAQETWAGDWNFWTGLGWEGTRFTGPQDDKYYRPQSICPLVPAGPFIMQGTHTSP